MAFEGRPDASTVACYVMTRGAERAWQALNRHLGQSGSAIFWIFGPEGAGKTHFLNYVLALDRNAGAISADAGQRLTIALDVAAPARAEDLETQVIETLARELAGSQRIALPWRLTRGEEALTVALDQARRQGVRAITLALDFGAADSDSALGYFVTLGKVCTGLKQPRLLVIAAGRGHAPSTAHPFDVGPADLDEVALAAIGRARILKPGAEAAFEDYYRGIDPDPFEPRQIFPLHPLSLSVLRTLANPPGTIAGLARLVRDVLASGPDGRVVSYRRPLVPAHLLESARVCAIVEARLGEPGRAALKMARAALAGLSEEGRKLGRQILDTIVLAHFGGGVSTLKLGDLLARLPANHNGALAAVRPERAMDSLLQVLAERSHGVIRFEGNAVCFDPRAAGAPEVAAFNAALKLIQRFDPTISAAQELPELKAKLKRLADAMANAFEAAHHTGEILAPIVNDPQVKLPPERRGAIADFAALAASGPTALIEAAADPERCEQALKTIAAYESMASAAVAAPRIAAMRDYLDTTGLRYRHDAAQHGKLEGLVSQCQLLAGQLSPAVLLGAPHNLDALQARFQQFRWAYVEEYRAAHQRWREEMRRLAAIRQDARRHLEALARLNSIKALGPAHGAGLEASMAAIDKRTVPCDFDGPLAPEVTPRCPQCGFVLGTPSPGPELDELFEEIRKALRSRLAALSRSAIARLIREHDHSRRLEGFLRITQAAQTEALVRVLDDELARYLARLIDENLTLAAREATVAGAEPELHAVVRGITGEQPKPTRRRAGNPKLE